MKPVILDADILSEYFRGNSTIISRVEEYRSEYSNINLTIITYYEILNGLLYKDAKKQLKKFHDFCKLNKVLYLTLDNVGISANIQA